MMDNENLVFIKNVHDCRYLDKTSMFFIVKFLLKQYLYNNEFVKIID